MELLVRRVLSVRSATAPRLGAGGLVFYLSDVTGVQQLWFFDGSRHDVYAPVEGRVGDYRVSKDGVVAVAVDRDG
ncbi:MAG: hypothetical protein QXW40_05965, partial [Thermofilum sp.]